MIKHIGRELIGGKCMKIAVAGTGYIGLSLATLLAQKNDVIALDIVPNRVEMINKRCCGQAFL